MGKGGKGFQRRLQRWLDEWRLAADGVILATKNRRFLVVMLLTLVVFGTLMNLLSGSTASVGLFWHVGLMAKLKILGDGFLGLLGFGKNFWDWILLFLTALLQSVLVGLVALVWRAGTRSGSFSGTSGGHGRGRDARHPRRRADATSFPEKSYNWSTAGDGVQNAGLAAGLAVLGTGCPTCGTTLLAPVIGAIFSSSSFALASTISGLLTFAAIIVALFTIKRLGNDAYALIISERRHARKKAAAHAEKSSEKPSQKEEK